MKSYKVIYVGLDNAGKTSILESLSRKYNYIEKVQQLQPTTKIERSTFKVLNIEIYNHDFGGQEKYRKEYLEYKDRFFADANLLYFVVDIQDDKRYQDTLKYFEDIANYFIENKMKLPILILFHKFDPDIIDSKEYILKAMNLKLSFNEYLPYLDLYYFETSIYNLYSILESFSFGMSKLFNKNEIINAVLQKIGLEFKALSVILLDETGVELGQFFKPHLNQQYISLIRKLFIEVEEKLAIENKNKDSQTQNDFIKISTKLIDESLVEKQISAILIKSAINYINIYIFICIEMENEKEISKIFDAILNYKLELNQIIQSILIEPTEFL